MNSAPAPDGAVVSGCWKSAKPLRPNLGSPYDGERITRTMLTEQDIISIGHATFRLSGGELRQYADESPGSLPAITKAHEVVAAYWAAAEARDWKAFGALLADDVIYRGPQAREQVRGRDPYIRFNVEGFPHDWHLTDDGKIAAITDYRPDPYELPASRAHLVERY